MLEAGEASSVLVGGVMLLLNPATSVGTDAMGILSPHGKARPFDKDADGLVRGEACGGMLLENQISDAVARFGFVRGSHSNDDNLGLQPGQPDQDAQEAVIAMAVAKAGGANAAVVHAEMHGEYTGSTRLLTCAC